MFTLYPLMHQCCSSPNVPPHEWMFSRVDLFEVARPAHELSSWLGLVGQRSIKKGDTQATDKLSCIETTR